MKNILQNEIDSKKLIYLGEQLTDVQHDVNSIKRSVTDINKLIGKMSKIESMLHKMQNPDGTLNINYVEWRSRGDWHYQIVYEFVANDFIHNAFIEMSKTKPQMYKASRKDDDICLILKFETEEKVYIIDAKEDKATLCSSIQTINNNEWITIK
jgi:hypothetical protein